MTRRYGYGALIVGMLTSSLVTVSSARAQLRDGGLLPPEESGNVTVVGCFLRSGDDSDKYVLAHPSRGPVENVQEETCAASAGDNALMLDNTKNFGMNDSMVGRWIEISGRLEKETDDNPDNLRELDVRAFRILPVVRPQAAAVPLPAVEEPIAPPPAEPIPVATTGEAPTLPKTASYVQASGLVGLVLLAGGLVIRSFRSRARG